MEGDPATIVAGLRIFVENCPGRLNKSRDRIVPAEGKIYRDIMVTLYIVAGIAILLAIAFCGVCLYKKVRNNGRGTAGKSRKDKRVEKTALSPEDKIFLGKSEEAIRERNALLDGGDFVDPIDTEAYQSKWKVLYETSLERLKKGRRLRKKRQTEIEAERFVSAYEKFPSACREHNDSVAALLMGEAEQLILPVEGKNLDSQQLRCVVTKVQNHLVLAGAGTGKTTTIVGYVKYLLKKGLCGPEDVLVLSFTNASAAEMSARLEREIGLPITALTFHKLGLNIIKKVQGKVPRIFNKDMRAFVREQLDILMLDRAYMHRLNRYLIFDSVPGKTGFDFSTEEGYREYLRSSPPVTLRREKVKSYGEMHIANFLTQYGIRYEYEKAYPVDTRTAEYGQYHPDFYLTDYGIYIEYFGIGRNGKVPKWFSGKGNKSPSESYREGMRWKRDLHKKYGTKLIEVYAYEHMEGNLLENLEGRLKDAGVVFEEMPPDSLWAKIGGTDNQKLDRLAELFGTVITLMKNRRYSVADVREISRRRGEPAGAGTVLDLVEPIFAAYGERLRSENAIDFNDMINVAADYVEQDRYRHAYRCVIIDEYQDMAQARYRLLYAMRKQSDYRLFCVGDDWQSIYRFNGSDIGFILNFSKYWGAAVTSRIETTYRFPTSLIEVSGSFIMKNPAQKKKRLKSPLPSTEFALEKLIGFSEKDAAGRIAEILRDLPENSSVLLLGRYRFDVQILDGNGAFSYGFRLEKKITAVRYSERKDLDITFMTVHGAKGLQADYVFILNNKRRGMGFPSQIADAPILDLLLDDSDSYPFAEERRLFYVALTRAKKKVFLVTLKGNESVFISELDRGFGPRLLDKRYVCPLCGGALVKKNGKYGEFLGCSNYKSLGCRYQRDMPGTGEIGKQNSVRRS